MAERRTTSLRRIDGRLVGAAVAVLLTLVVAAVAVRGPGWTRPGHTVAPAAPVSGTTTSAPPTESANPGNTPSLPRSEVSGGVMLVLLLGIGLVLLVSVATGLARTHLAHRRAPLAAPVPLLPVERALAEATDAALRAVEQPDAREAVVRAWLLLGAAAAGAGVPARPAETATEYAQRIAAGFPVPTRDLQRLAELYREARFSGHPIGEIHRGEARDLLVRLRAGLRSGTR